MDTISVAAKQKLSHKKWRALLKKQRRKCKRRAEALLREKQEGCTEEVENESDDQTEECSNKDHELQHQLWLEREKLAQLQWKAKIKLQEEEKQRQKEQELKIKREWEEREEREKEEEAKRKKEKDEKEKKQGMLLEQATANENKDAAAWHNPLAPRILPGVERTIENCPFYMKTGACRFGDRCSRGHPKPESSCTLLFPGMYSHFKLSALTDEYDTDMWLEYEDSETYQHFLDFYNDVLPEFKKIGRIVQFKVCCNYELHLRGNVYVQFRREEDAHRAFLLFNARWYGGRQLNCEFTVVDRWKSAICGTFHQKKCPKGKGCNFLHVFKNPNNEFWEADKDMNIIATSNSYRSHRPLHSYHNRRMDERTEHSRSYRSRSPDYRYSNSYRKKRSTVGSPGQSRRSYKRSRSHSSSPRERRSYKRSRSHSSSPRERRSYKRSRSPSSSPREKRSYRSRQSRSISPRSPRYFRRSQSRSPDSKYSSSRKHRKFRSPSRSRRAKESKKGNGETSPNGLSKPSSSSENDTVHGYEKDVYDKLLINKNGNFISDSSSEKDDLREEKEKLIKKNAKKKKKKHSKKLKKNKALDKEHSELVDV